MFGTLLHRSIKIDDKNFHLLFDVGAHVDQLEKVGQEIIKLAEDIRQKAKEEEQKECTNCETPCSTCGDEPPKE